MSLIGKTTVANMSSVHYTNEITSCPSGVWRDGMALAEGLQIIDMTSDGTDTAPSGVCA